MILSLLLTAGLFSAAQAAPFSFFGKRQTPCPPSHLIIARGSTEPPGPGLLVTLATKVIATNPGTTMETIVYPATLENYESSATNGTQAVQQQLSTFVQQCPNSKVVMMGFSQGAQIMGDALGGGGIQGLQRFNAPVGRAVSGNVAAVVMYGDPRHIVTAPFNVGTATKDGVRFPWPLTTYLNTNHVQVFPRATNQTLNAFADRTRAFCNGKPFQQYQNRQVLTFEFRPRPLLRLRGFNSSSPILPARI
jgi:acetylxylan esterase